MSELLADCMSPRSWVTKDAYEAVSRNIANERGTICGENRDERAIGGVVFDSTRSSYRAMIS